MPSIIYTGKSSIFLQKNRKIFSFFKSASVVRRTRHFARSAHIRRRFTALLHVRGRSHLNKKRRTRGGESFPFSYAPFFYMPDVLYVKLSWVCRIEAATATHDRRRSLPCGYSDISLRLSPRCQESSASISIDWFSSQKLYHNSENISMLFGEFVREIVGLDMAAAKSA